MLNLKQIFELFGTMKNIIMERQETDKLEEMDLCSFIEWINGLIRQYIEEDETEDIYKYVEDNIFDVVCCE
jgi:hypothetical protein